VWTGASPDPDRLADLRRRELVAADTIELTDDGRTLVEVCERRTNELTGEAFATIDQDDLDALVAALRRLPGEDPRPMPGR
jgi:DNA-binding MarR family transcriptional regulator